ncbi:LOW QUALITY PROTEIN: putative deoxyribonuclease tatdn3-A [Ciconia maguari]
MSLPPPAPQRHPDSVTACFGVHPIQSRADGQCSASLGGIGPAEGPPRSAQNMTTGEPDVESVLPLFEKYKDKLVAIGKVGLDFAPWLVPTPQQREEQQRVLALWLATAKQLDLPVCSGRTAPNFAGRQSVTLEGVQAGYYFSFLLAITRHDRVKKLIKQIPLENICLETDSPSLAPNKEERNESEEIRIVCQHIASVKGISVEGVCEVTKNASKLCPKVNQPFHE